MTPSMLLAGGPDPQAREPSGPLTPLASSTVASDANSGRMLEDVRVDGRDIHMDCRFPISSVPVREQEDGNSGLGRLASLVLELLDEFLVGIGRKISHGRLIVDAEHQVRVRSLFGEGKA